MLALCLFALAAASFPGEADRVTSLPGVNETLPFGVFSGYLDINATTGKRFHYYFVESQTSPSSDPLVRWLSGGPGCSSVGGGGFEETGPLLPDANGNLQLNPFAWNRNANMVYIDSPTGVGWSYSKTKSDYTNGDASTAADNYVAIAKFLEKFPQFENRDFYLTGESYVCHMSCFMTDLCFFPPKSVLFLLFNCSLPFRLGKKRGKPFSPVSFFETHRSPARHYIPTLTSLLLDKPLPLKFKGFAVGNPTTHIIDDFFYGRSLW